MKLAPVATELLGYYRDGDNSKHGITNIEYTEHGLRVVDVSKRQVFGYAARIQIVERNRNSLYLELWDSRPEDKIKRKSTILDLSLIHI